MDDELRKVKLSFEELLRTMHAEEDEDEDDTCKLGDVERAELRSRTVTEALAEAEAELLRDDVHRLGNENKRLERELNTALTRLQLSQQSLQEVQAVFMCNSSMSPPRSPSGPDSPALRLADNEEQGKGDGPGVEKLQQDLIQAKLAVAELATDDTKLKRRVAELEKMLAHTKLSLALAKQEAEDVRFSRDDLQREVHALKFTVQKLTRSPVSTIRRPFYPPVSPLSVVSIAPPALHVNVAPAIPEHVEETPTASFFSVIAGAFVPKPPTPVYIKYPNTHA